ncbi:MAG: hypothetical protein ACK5GN_12420 [Pseudomonadota bacterium]|jgi:hypothetical protein
MSETVAPDAALKKTWQKVPQEERNEILSRAQGKAIEVCSLVAVLGSAAAFGLQISWIAIGVVALLPVLFQTVVARSLLYIKPQTIARYYLAGRTAGQYALALHLFESSAKTIFRGVFGPLKEPSEDSDPEFAMDMAEELSATSNEQKEVWIALFSDALIMFSENTGGTRLEFSHSILRDFNLTLDTPEDATGTSLPPRLVIDAPDADGNPARWVVSTRHTSALVACERKVRFFTQRAKDMAALEAQHPPKRGSHSLFASKQLGATLEAVSH